MQAFTPTVLVMMLIAVMAQVTTLSLLPMTRGLTQPWPVAGAIGAYLVGFVMMSRIIYSGMNLNVLIPAVAALVPFGVILVGVFVHGEPASPAKIITLLVACVLIAVANML